MTIFDGSKIWHGTKINDIRYSQLGVVLAVKKVVLKVGENKMEAIGFTQSSLAFTSTSEMERLLVSSACTTSPTNSL